MCAGKVLASFYNEVYGSAFDVKSTDASIKMQKAVYLLNEVGVALGDYQYIWFKHGPYSDMLDYDSAKISTDDIGSNFEFNSRAKEAIHTVKTIVNKPPTEMVYSETHWAEAIASIHYISHYMYPGIDTNDVLNKLVILKPHLSSDQSNQCAQKLVSAIS